MAHMWTGRAPEFCEICHSPITTAFYDVAIPTAGGAWGCICTKCFMEHKCSTGIGRGQKYEYKKEVQAWICTDGSTLSAKAKRQEQRSPDTTKDSDRDGVDGDT